MYDLNRKWLEARDAGALDVIKPRYRKPLLYWGRYAVAVVLAAVIALSCLLLPNERVR